MQNLYIQLRLIELNLKYPELEIFDGQPIENVRIIINEVFGTSYTLLDLLLAFPSNVEYLPIQEIPEDFEIVNKEMINQLV